MRGTISRAARHSSRGFSLVELMVVIGIIALLIGIALPAFNQAKQAAKVATTTATINSIATGMETFRADERMGGEYPPSQYTTLPYNPHLPVGVKQKVDVMGANLAVYALAGADLLGSAGNVSNPDVLNAEPPNGLYYLKGGIPNTPRTSFVDVTKMKFPQNVALVGAPPQYRMPNWGSGPKNYLNSLVFLDSFDQPILYYRARLGSFRDFAGGAIPPTQPNTTYNMYDNTLIAGGNSGLDLGAGTHHFQTGVKANLELLNLFNATNRELMRKSFAYTIWNPNVTAKPASHNPETYILLSAGPDGIFGTEDDVGNFPTNK